MKNFTRIGSFLMIVCTPIASSYAVQAIYQWTDENGELHFSDRPMHGAEKRVLKEVQTYESKKNTPQKQKALLEENKDKSAQYNQITFASPSDNATYRNASNTLAASLIIEPKLKETHQIQFYLDNEAVGLPQKDPNYVYQDIYRGTHTISASIVNENGKVISSTKSITVFMHPPRANIKKTNNEAIKVFNSVKTVLNTQKVTQ